MERVLILIIYDLFISLARYTFLGKYRYLIPINIRTPLIFAHLAYANIKGSKFAQYECAKTKGRRKNATNE